MVSSGNKILTTIFVVIYRIAVIACQEKSEIVSKPYVIQCRWTRWYPMVTIYFLLTKIIVLIYFSSVILFYSCCNFTHAFTLQKKLKSNMCILIFWYLCITYIGICPWKMYFLYVLVYQFKKHTKDKRTSFIGIILCVTNIGIVSCNY